jgi:hypothetical protein
MIIIKFNNISLKRVYAKTGDLSTEKRKKLLVSVPLAGIFVHAPEKQLPIMEFQQLETLYGMEGHNALGCAYPDAPEDPVRLFHKKARPLWFSILCEKRIKSKMRFLHTLQ